MNTITKENSQTLHYIIINITPISMKNKAFIQNEIFKIGFPKKTLYIPSQMF